MNTWLSDDFLLLNDTARELYHDKAANLPILDYHNHLDQHAILADKNYKNLYDIWLSGDHYKWRAMRANGIEESYITGKSDDFEKFTAWAKTVPNTLGNPLYHWTHLELKRYFGINKLLNEQTAKEIWEIANEKLLEKDMSTRSLLQKEKVKFVGTTDDPTDDLESHRKLREEGYEVMVSPSFRPDNGLNIEREDFTDWLKKLETAANMSIINYSEFLIALEGRVSYFDEHGCKSSDHGIGNMFFELASKEDVKQIFTKRLSGEALTDVEIDQFKTYTLLTLGELYAEKGWIMQLHLGAIRNNNTRMFNRLGLDSGYDSIGDVQKSEKVSGFLNELEKNDRLPKTVLYNLNPNDNFMLATMAGNFQNDEVKGKVQFGTAWWFNDTIDGMESQMKCLANTGLISNFIGMLTDSRSILSFSRHDYFRRVLCNLFGTWVEEGRAPKDMNLLGEYVQNICYNNAKRYFNLAD